MTPEEIYNLQSQKNSGRGISCVQSLLFFYNKGNVQSAINCYHNEHDKIRSYPDVDEKIRKLLGIPPKPNKIC